MATITFDSHAFIKRLKESGFSEAQNLSAKRNERPSAGGGRSGATGVDSSVNEDCEHRPPPDHGRAVVLQTGSQAEVITQPQQETVSTSLEQARQTFHLDELARKHDVKEIDLKIDTLRADLRREIAESKAGLIR